ncbi:MAG: leucine-rich repeat domain-containing protein, partial [Clostridia bacterium]|nr:leucine-rich repeat domain-containing protein [Clostridia bacterium]
MKRILKRVLSVIIVLAILFGAAPLSGFKGVGSSLWNGLCSIAASAKEGVEEIIETLTPANVSDNTLDATGQCGDNVYWTFNSSTGALNISGTGKMYNYSYNGSPFYYNSSIKSVTIESGVTSIGEWAFVGCKSLTSIEIPDSVTSIGDHAFYYCRSSTSIEIPDSVTSIGNSAFGNCSSLTSITVYNNNNNYSSDSFGVLYNKDKTELIQYPIGNERTSFTIPESVTSIGSYAFYNCSSLTSIEIPDSVTSIGDDAFYECSSLTSIEIPDSVTSIGDYTFYYCSRLTSVTIG